LSIPSQQPNVLSDYGVTLNAADDDVGYKTSLADINSGSSFRKFSKFPEFPESFCVKNDRLKDRQGRICHCVVVREVELPRTLVDD
jgi:hypothetical protein